MCHCLTLSTPFEDASGDAAQTIQNICDGKVTLPPAQHYSKLGGKVSSARRVHSTHPPQSPPCTCMRGHMRDRRCSTAERTRPPL
eukprot:1934615-Prymnesium_polylepis.1